MSPAPVLRGHAKVYVVPVAFGRPRLMVRLSPEDIAAAGLGLDTRAQAVLTQGELRLTQGLQGYSPSSGSACLYNLPVPRGYLGTTRVEPVEARVVAGPGWAAVSLPESLGMSPWEGVPEDLQQSARDLRSHRSLEGNKAPKRRAVGRARTLAAGDSAQARNSRESPETAKARGEPADSVEPRLPVPEPAVLVPSEASLRLARQDLERNRARGRAVVSMPGDPPPGRCALDQGYEPGGGLSGG